MQVVKISLDENFFFIRTYTELSDGRLRLNMHFDRWIEALPDFKRLDGAARVGATDLTVKSILKHAPNAQLEDDAQLMLRYWQAVEKQSLLAAENVANFKERGVLPVDSYSYGDKLVAYQRLAAHNAIESPGYLLLMKQGTGKTPVAIKTVVNDSLRQNKKHRSIVVCPPGLRMNWKREFAEFADIDVDCHILRGTAINRLDALLDVVKSPCKTAVAICSYDVVRHSWDHISSLEWDVAILDEGQAIKDEKTKRAAYAYKLGAKANKRLLLTGTPVANTILDLYSLFHFIGPGSSGFQTLDGFKKHFAKFRFTEDGRSVFEQAQNIPVLKDRLARFSFIITKEEAMPYLPQKTNDVFEVEMTEEQIVAYELLRDELVIEAQATMEQTDNQAVAVNNILVQLLKLSQITSSFKVISEQRDTDGNVLSPRTVIPFKENVKVQAIIKEFLPEKGPNDKTIIWSNWIEDVLAMRDALVAAGESPVIYYGQVSEEDRIIAEDRFNKDRSCKWFIGNQGCGGAGLNLLGYDKHAPEQYETNCNHVIYMSQDWSSIKRDQSEDRAHRRGTRVPVRVTELLVPDTIDTIVSERVQQKRENAKSITDVREILVELMRKI